jgi:alkanesulfonate monooxygenase SsuD/methylene tetrahydromethanopterin reductase-like flavin-dependent oxidoreductase (luciferase family)
VSGPESRGISWETHPWVDEAQRRIRFGVGVTTPAPIPDWTTRRTLAQALDALGFDSHWAPDHPAFAPDCWSILAALAGATSRIRLGPLVNCVGYRTPMHLARVAADVDRLSGGRLILGLGCGWVGVEFAQLGLSYPPVAERQQLLTETVEVLHRLWGTAPGSAGPPDTTYAEPFFGRSGPPPLTYQGERIQLDGVCLRPIPVQQPRIPIMIAGAGERVTLRQVARFADASNFGIDGTPGAVQTVEEVKHKLAVLHRHCDEAGRSPASVLPTHFTNPVILAETAAALEEKRASLPPFLRTVRGFSGTPEEAVVFYRPLVAAGLRYFIVNITAYDDLETARLLAERVIPALDEQGQSH